MKHILLVMTVLLLSACGYHLRGSLNLPEGLKTIYIQGASSPLRNALKKVLRSADATQVDNAKDAGLVIEVEKETMQRDAVSLSVKGRANEYELSYRLGFLLLDSQGNVLSESQSIEITRDYFNNQEEMLGKDNEEQMIRKEMYRQAITSILNQSSIVLRKVDRLTPNK